MFWQWDSSFRLKVVVVSANKHFYTDTLPLFTTMNNYRTTSTKCKDKEKAKMIYY